MSEARNRFYLNLFKDCRDKPKNQIISRPYNITFFPAVKPLKITINVDQIIDMKDVEKWLEQQLKSPSKSQNKA